MSLHPVLFEKLNAALLPTAITGMTARDARLPAVPGKVYAVIGMRRAGKTTYLRQLQAERRTSLPPDHTRKTGAPLAGCSSARSCSVA